MTQTLFAPIQLGKIALQHRVALAPLTRFRATETHVPTDLAVKYYEQRATRPGTLLITEAAFIAERAGGYNRVPGLWNKEQLAGWTKVFDVVHAKGSFVFVQIWGLGKSALAMPNYLAERGFEAVSSANVPSTDGKSPDVRALTTAEVKEYIQDFITAGKNAIEAGADGVEVHGANGYIFEQFLNDILNSERTDEYGGSIENRARFLLEVIDGLIEAVGADKVGVRLSPYNTFGGMTVSPLAVAQYAYVLAELQKRADAGKELAYVHTMEAEKGTKHASGKSIAEENLEWIRTVWNGVWVRNRDYRREDALKLTSADPKVVVSFGRDFISNPDLVQRLENNWPLNEGNSATHYTNGAEGYIDYPFYKEE
ncbi:hypothetical protein EC973_005120 [Apophysomyces ossiformis]|uniref:NADH:flavin oxidoreductase/NADH oxidase N-terminal domain-containing protein n=1 Tax=Apophysomyces ossiformis TaxID=679940 RepID=A0A8H7BE28_9FUNG|nr:hypothetical protein EC973_005120 [Apophysomyces ossiformis]